MRGVRKFIAGIVGSVMLSGVVCAGDSGFVKANNGMRALLQQGRGSESIAQMTCEAVKCRDEKSCDMAARIFAMQIRAATSGEVDIYELKFKDPGKCSFIMKYKKRDGERIFMDIENGRIKSQLSNFPDFECSLGYSDFGSTFVFIGDKTKDYIKFQVNGDNLKLEDFKIDTFKKRYFSGYKDDVVNNSLKEFIKASVSVPYHIGDSKLREDSMVMGMLCQLVSDSEMLNRVFPDTVKMIKSLMDRK